MAKKPLPSVDVLRQLLRYEAETGQLFWRVRTADVFEATAGRSAEHACALWNSRYAGKEALASPFEGYLYGKLLGQTELAHRVAWAIHYGEPPPGEIDHINHRRSDNRIINLRIVSDRDNARNQTLRKTSTSNVVGVSFHKLTGKWAAYISDGGRIKHLGLFESKEEAATARNNASLDCGYHPNHGKAA